MALVQSDAIEVKRVPGKGRGVFARRLIRAGELIERVPVIVMPAGDVGDEDNHNSLWEYSFQWGEGKVALALGYGSLYNHSFEPNARCEISAPRCKVFLALRDIHPGEEITINYNGEPDDPSPVWFDVVETENGSRNGNGNGSAPDRSRRSTARPRGARA